MRNRAREAPVVSHGGFSILESLIVMGIIGMLAATTMTLMATSTSQGAIYESHALVLHALERARSNAVAGIGTQSHGVFVQEGMVVRFEGPAYIPGTGDPLPLVPGTTTNHVGTEIIFERLSAKTNAPIGDFEIIITNKRGDSRSIHVTQGGAIVP